MAELAVVVISTDPEQRNLLQMMVDGTGIARTVLTLAAFPVGITDMVLRRIQDTRADVLLLDIPSQTPTTALHAIELLQEEAPKSAVFTVGDMNQPQVIVAAMRAGAREYLERPPKANQLVEAFARLASSQHKGQSGTERGQVFTVLNAKGGSGATTVAVNTALALHHLYGNVALVDLAPLGHAALHLNIKPVFTVEDALRNLHRLDPSLLEGFMTRHAEGLWLLAGPSQPLAMESSAGDFARLFDLLVSQYQHVVVDASTRFDRATRIVCDLSQKVLLVAHADVTSLWSAAQIQNYLSESGKRNRMYLVLNRFQKIPGFSEEDAEKATHLRLLGKIPNHYAAVISSIDRGDPVAQENRNNSEIARSFRSIATALGAGRDPTQAKARSLFRGKNKES